MAGTKNKGEKVNSPKPISLKGLTRDELHGLALAVSRLQEAIEEDANGKHLSEHLISTLKSVAIKLQKVIRVENRWKD